jgi:hypothetical protein
MGRLQRVAWGLSFADAVQFEASALEYGCEVIIYEKANARAMLTPGKTSERTSLTLQVANKSNNVVRPTITHKDG